MCWVFDWRRLMKVDEAKSKVERPFLQEQTKRVSLMASVVKLGRGKQSPRAIDFIDEVDGERVRPRLRLGVVTHDFAEKVCRRVESLVSTKRLNQEIQPELAAWLAGLPVTLYDKLARFQLCPPRNPESDAPMLGEWMAKYIDQRGSDLKPASIDRLEQTADRLKAFFGEETKIDELTASGAADWRAAMVAEKLAEATIRLHARNAKSMFAAAVDRELIHRSPLGKLKSSAIAAKRDRDISQEETERLLAACPSLQWRVLVGLTRYAGLRCDSETHGVTWADVDWERRRLRVYACKTDSTRIVPIVPSLLTLLQDAFDAAEEGATTIITLSRNNLHRSFLAIQARSGVVEWDDLFQSLRRSCESDLAKRHPQHAVSRWMGHSMKVSEKHYLMVGDDLYDAASNDPVLRVAESAAASDRIASQAVVCSSEVLNESPVEAQTEARTMPMVATSCGLVLKVDRGGIEPPTPGFSVLCSTN